MLENVVLYNNGQGEFKYIVNFSQSRNKINFLIEQGEVEGYKIPPKDIIKKNFETSMDKATEVDGIINAGGSCDLDNYIMEFACEFKTIAALNEAADLLKSLSPELDQKDFTYFSFDQATRMFKRNGDDMLSDQYEQMSPAQRMIFSGAYYTCIYRFETEIDTILSENCKVSKNRKASFKKVPVSDIASNGSVLTHIIKLK